jgi:predicted AlkP superfamily phosphohydrolase/phosphomutase
MIDSNRNLLLIGIDGASAKLVHELIAKGRMPNLERLKDNPSCILQSIFPTLTCPAIPSMYTGKNPGKTGVFDFRKADGSITSFWDVKDKTFWDYLGDKGLKSLIFNVGLTAPTKPLNGIMVSDFNIRFTPRSYTYPENIKAEFKDIDVTPEKFNEMYKLRFTNPERTYQMMLDEIEKYYSAFVKLMEKDNFDFSFFWIAESDTLLHWLDHRPDLIADFFSNIDDIIGRLIAKYPLKDVLIISDHGVNHTAEYKFHLNQWLTQVGILKTSNIFSNKIKIAGQILKHSRNIVLKKLIKIRGSLAGRKSHLATEPLADYSDSSFDPFSYLASLGFDKENSVFFLAPSYKWGIMANSDITNKDQKIDDLIQKMKTLKYRGKKIFQQVWRREELYSGKFVEMVPEICFALENLFFSDRLFGWRTFRKLSNEEKAGDHIYAPEGILFSKGRSFDVNFRAKKLSLLDIMPIVLTYYDIPLPKDIDGTFPEGLLLNPSSQE